MNQQIDHQKKKTRIWSPKNTTTQTPTNVAMLRISTSCGQQIWCKAGRFDWKTMAKHLLPKNVTCTAVLPTERMSPQCHKGSKLCDSLVLKSHEWFESIWVLWDPEIEKMLRFEICVGSGCANFTTTKPRTVSNPCPAAPNDGNHKPALNDHQNKCKRTAHPSVKSVSASVVSCRAQFELKKLTVVAWNDGPSRISSPDWSLPTKLCCYDPPPCANPKVSLINIVKTVSHKCFHIKSMLQDSGKSFLTFQ